MWLMTDWEQCIKQITVLMRALSEQNEREMVMFFIKIIYFFVHQIQFIYLC